jgi:hypothetical protein
MNKHVSVKATNKERITNKEDILTVHAAEIADVHDGDSSYNEVFVCIYLSVLQHISRSNASKGPLPLPSDLPQSPQCPQLSMVCSL